uniref:AlNc14C276G10047 protein n=1 Tax=Albugo laibachii Nc14 TaxID=890382 RepID=F0WUP0_9STRA|nr:AlNc14C276G10047 [Albugo laibachii Nc14]|eukprot:CCA25121.1 AlNc14C276G10047 [Albugo laibachii Nc14]
MTALVRGVNERTERMVWPIPMLELVMEHLHGTGYFFPLDFSTGYRQFFLEKSSQENFSFLTDTGVYTPTRVLMRGSDSGAYCQSMVQEMFSDQYYKELLIWLDDLI